MLTEIFVAVARKIRHRNVMLSGGYFRETRELSEKCLQRLRAEEFRFILASARARQ